MKKQQKYLIAAAAVSGMFLMAGTAFAAGGPGKHVPPPAHPPKPIHEAPHAKAPKTKKEKPVLKGKVTSLSGSVFTVSGKKGVLYSIETSSATLLKGHGKKATSTTFAEIKLGDKVTVFGSATGTSVIADPVFLKTK